MTTPLSSNVAYASPTDLKRYRHWAQIADWLSGLTGSSGSRVSESDLTDSATPSTAYTLLNEHLKAASGLVESACFRGARYSVFNLMDWASMSSSERTAFETILGRSWTSSDTAQNLVGSSRSLLKRIVCCLAIGTLSRFKSRTAGDERDEAFGFEMLDALSAGKRIFALTEAGDAGLPGNVEMAPAGSTQEEDRVSVQAGRLFGNRRA